MGLITCLMIRPEKTTVGIILDPALKKRLKLIAKIERRSLSSQAELFLLQSVRLWGAAQPEKIEPNEQD